MLQRPPRSTRTDTLFPDTTLFRSGVRHDLIDAVFALGGEDDLVRLLARVKALQAFMATEDGANLLAGYKRAANILKQAGKDVAPAKAGAAGSRAPNMAAPAFAGATEMDKRTEERRVGKEGGSRCRLRWSPHH